MAKMMMIGDLAAATGTKVNTIRFYEEIGLMRRAARTDSGRRTYGQADLERLRFIRLARKLGFETVQIRSLLALADEPGRECAEVAAIAFRHLDDVDEKIAQLTMLRDELDRMARLCAGGTVSACRILEALNAPVEGPRLQGQASPGGGAAAGVVERDPDRAHSPGRVSSRTHTA